MQRLTTRLITEQIDPNSLERYELRMVLRPATLDFREQFRNELQNQLNRDLNIRLPGVDIIENTNTIDGQDIIEINNRTSSERITEFMQNIINYENINDNSSFLITNSSNQVRTYLNDLLVRSASLFPINEDDLYQVGNIFLYTIANLEIETLNLRDIIQHLRAHMVIYNTDQIINILENHIPVYNDYLENIRLATDEQLEERMVLNRRRIMYAGLGLVGSMALSSAGLPPVGGVIARTIANVSTNSASSNEIIRLRDVWDDQS